MHSFIMLAFLLPTDKQLTIINKSPIIQYCNMFEFEFNAINTDNFTCIRNSTIEIY